MKKRVALYSIFTLILVGIFLGVGAERYELWNSTIRINLQLVDAVTSNPVVGAYGIILKTKPDDGNKQTLREYLTNSEEGFMYRHRSNPEPSREYDHSSVTGELNLAVNRQFSTHRVFPYFNDPEIAPPTSLWVAVHAPGYQLTVFQPKANLWVATDSPGSYRQTLTIPLHPADQQ